MAIRDTGARIRYGADEVWTRLNPVLGAGTMAYSLTDGTVRIGDGQHHWADLPSIGTGGGSGGSSLPSGGSPGQVLKRTASGAEWAADEVGSTAGLATEAELADEAAAREAADAALAALFPAHGDATVSATLAAGQGASTTLALAPAFVLLSLSASRTKLRVRLYSNSTYADADVDREIGVDPEGNHGLILEFVTTAAVKAAMLSPAPIGIAPSGAATVRIDNLADTSVSVSVTFTWLPLEAE